MSLIKRLMRARVTALAVVCTGALALFAASDSFGDSSKTPEGSGLKVMSFNIRTLTMEEDARDNWSFRKKHVADLILRHDVDLIGMQEAYALQAKGLESLLPDYDWFGPPRDDGEKRGERCPIFYRRDRLDLLGHGTFWLSETPDVKGSVSWNSACKRIVTWGKFKDKQSGEVFFFFNTHFDHVSKLARKMSAQLIVERIDTIAGEGKAVVTGDFNTTDTTVPYKTMAAALKDAKLISITKPKGPEGTSRSFRQGAPPKKRIDYIFVSKGIKVADYAVLDDTYKNDRRPSDHMPVMVTVSF